MCLQTNESAEVTRWFVELARFSSSNFSYLEIRILFYTRTSRLNVFCSVEMTIFKNGIKIPRKIKGGRNQGGVKQRILLLRTSYNIIYDGKKVVAARRNKVWTLIFNLPALYELSPNYKVVLQSVRTYQVNLFNPW